MNNEVIIYKDGELELQVEVTSDKETVWLLLLYLNVLTKKVEQINLTY